MPNYRVYGSKVIDYYTVVAAANTTEAYEIANSRNTGDWNEVEDDRVIEITDIIRAVDIKEVPIQGQLI